MQVARKEWVLHPYPTDHPNWVLDIVRFGESLGEKCFALLEGKEDEHQRTYLAFGEGWTLTRKNFEQDNRSRQSEHTESPDPLHHLRGFLQTHHPNHDLESGLIGYLDFEWGLKWQKPSSSLATPDYFFRLSPINLVLLPLSQRVVLEVLSEEKERLEQTFKLWSHALDRFLMRDIPNSSIVSTPTTPTTPTTSTTSTTSATFATPATSATSATSAIAPTPQKSAPSWYSNISKEGFLKRVEQIKEYIRAGDIFQAVPSQCFKKDVQLNPWTFYQKLRILNPSPYLFCVFGERETLVGSSPELLISSVGSHLQTRPIAGTRPRGKTLEEDLTHEKELLQDPKEMAEHAMLVDLGRNDLGRVSKYGSVKVNQYAGIQRFSHVMHIVSTVEGHLDPAYDSLEALKAVFPAGTLSGAPKVRALEILQELESEPRGAYGGALGIVRWNGDLDFCITIRTLSIKEHQVRVQTGAGIVFDSLPEREFEETVHKAQALLKVVDECVSGP